MIKLSKMTDYGVVIMCEMARIQGRIMNAPDLSLHTGLTVPTAAKVLRVLAKNGLLTSIRGAHGGYRLDRTPVDIPIVEIIRVLEGPVAVTSCVDESDEDCSVETCCPMRGGWEKINRAINAALEEVTLADMRQSVPNISTTPSDGPETSVQKQLVTE
jgi:FeS assembly SUF system regulator